MIDQELPPGWDHDKIRAVIDHHDSLTEEEEYAEIEAMAEAENVTFVAVPTDRVAEVTALLSRPAPN